jgi:carbohydrate kinase (thermoresistant glucokinase family)
MEFSGAVVVMGVASCGKTTLGEALAARLNVPFVEGDKLHSAENVAKMSKGIPLTDEDRWPWLSRVGETLAGSTGAIVSCSALKRIYRDRITEIAGRPVAFLLLHGDKALLQKRIANRKGHFMPASLLESQLATLEVPGVGENAVIIDIALPVEVQLAKAVHFLMKDHIL